MDYLASFLDSFLDFPWRDAYGVVRTVFIVLDAALFVGFIYALVKAFEYRPKFYRNLQSFAKKPIVKDPALIKRWAGIFNNGFFCKTYDTNFDFPYDCSNPPYAPSFFIK